MEIMELEAPRRSHGHGSSSSSSEFEFWMVGNHPELEPECIHTADELFVDGVLLPLRLLSLHASHHDPNSEPKLRAESPESSASIASSPVATSRRWKDIFKKSSSSSSAVVEEKGKEKEKEKAKVKKERIRGSRTELNINIWPFSRIGTPKPSAAAMSKCSSAPCSRNNSRGVRRWAASPGRPGGLHVGRVSPLWQVRPKAKAVGSGARIKEGGPRGMNLTVNSCIGYNGQRCREDGEVVVGGAAVAANVRLFRLGGLFMKKV